MGNRQLRRRLIRAGQTLKDPSLIVASLQEKVMNQAKELAEVSKKASDGTKLGMIRQIQKRFPDAHPKCPNCGYHSLGYDDIIDHMRNIHDAHV